MKLSIDEIGRYASAMETICNAFSVRCRKERLVKYTTREVDDKSTIQLVEIMHAAFRLVDLCHKVTTAMGDVQADVKVEERSE